MNANVSVSAGSEIVICAADGMELVRHTAAKDEANLIFSCPGIRDGDELTITVDGQAVQVTAGHESCRSPDRLLVIS